jgi:sec-independent protein translocase protein TatA
MELMIILGVVLIIFGPGKLPDVGAGLGKGIKGFQKALSGKQETALPASTASEEAAPGYTTKVEIEPS